MSWKKMLALALAGAMAVSALAGCHDSSEGPSKPGAPGSSGSGSAVQTGGKVDYDPEEAIAPYIDALPEIPEADKDLVIEMGYNNCDHMVAAIIGQDTGLYKALGLNGPMGFHL